MQENFQDGEMARLFEKARTRGRMRWPLDESQAEAGRPDAGVATTQEDSMIFRLRKRWTDSNGNVKEDEISKRKMREFASMLLACGCCDTSYIAIELQGIANWMEYEERKADGK